MGKVKNRRDSKGLLKKEICSKEDILFLVRVRLGREQLLVLKVEKVEAIEETESLRVVLIIG